MIKQAFNHNFQFIHVFIVYILLQGVSVDRETIGW